MKENLLCGLRRVTRSLRNDTWLCDQGSSMPRCQSTSSCCSTMTVSRASSGASSSRATARARFPGPAPMARISTSSRFTLLLFRRQAGWLSLCGGCAGAGLGDQREQVVDGAGLLVEAQVERYAEAAL